MSPSKLSHLLIRSTLVVPLVGTISICAQIALPKTDGETVEMSPFVISADQDRGYVATATLSGSRLKTNLRDVAAPVSIVTMDLANDVGASNIQDVLSFVGNAERAVDAYNTATLGPASARIRGMSVDGNRVNFFRAEHRTDAYNLARWEVNRGPNSLLYGIGNPAGIITATTVTAGFKNAGSTSYSVDSLGSTRAEADYNVVIVPGKLAMRAAVLNQQEEYARQPSFWNERRLFYTGTWNVAKQRNYSAELRWDFEYANADRAIFRNDMPIDGLSVWQSQGQNTANRQFTTATGLPAGLRRYSARTLVTTEATDQSFGPAVNYLNWTRSVLTPVNNQQIGPNGPVPFATNYAGSANRSDYQSHFYSASLEQRFGEKFHVELAWARNPFALQWYPPTGNILVEADTNEIQPNGSPNPNLGKYFIQAVMRLQDRKSTTDELRLAASYEQNLTGLNPWLGRHQLSALLTSENQQTLQRDYDERNLTPLTGFSSAIGNNENQIYRRTYSPADGSRAYLPGISVNRLPFLTDGAGGINSGWAPNLAGSNQASANQGAVIAAQSFWFKDRLVTTAGLRYSAVQIDVLDPVANGADSRLLYADPSTLPMLKKAVDVSKVLKTWSGVWHVADWLSLFYNYSDTYNPDSPRLAFNGAPLVPPVGKTRDFGVKTRLLNQMLNINVNFYQSAVNGSQDDALRSLIPNFNSVFAPATEAILRPAHPGINLSLPTVAFSTANFVAKGAEIEIVYNPSTNWRIRSTVSRNETVKDNIAKDSVAWFENNFFVWQKEVERSAPTFVFSDGETFAQYVATIQNAITNQVTTLNGRKAPEIRDWSGSFVTSYRFSEGSLKGITFGANASFSSKANVGYLTNGAEVFGRERLAWGGFASYEMRLSPQLRGVFRLGVKNAFRKEQLNISSVDSVTGQTRVYEYLPGPSYTAKMTIAF